MISTWRFLATALLSAAAFGGSLEVTDNSLFAVVTQKGGLAKGLAHNHLIYATQFEARLEVEPDKLTELSFSFSSKAEDLAVDSPAVSTQWFPKIKTLGMVKEAFSEVSQKDRDKIRKTMLGSKQLNAKKFPTIQARLLRVSAQQGKMGERSFAYALDAELTIHGQTKTVTLLADMTFEDGVFRLEACGSAKFTDFGVKPYSALFGAVSNKDPFFFFISLEAS